MTSDAAPSHPVSHPAAPAAALAAHAARHPHRPFLFWPEGLDWRWMSFAEAVAEVERLREGVARRVEEQESAVPPAVVEVLEEIAEGERVGGGAVVAGAGQAGGGPVARGRAVAGAVGSEGAAGVGARRPRQEVVVLAPPFTEEGGGELLAWAVLAGAALVVEPSRGGLVATAGWARPTVFRGTVAEIAALAREAAAAERSGLAGFWRRLRRWLGGEPPPPRPFGRLHTVVVSDGPADTLDAAFWRTRGTRLLVEPFDTDPAAAE